MLFFRLIIRIAAAKPNYVNFGRLYIVVFHFWFFEALNFRWNGAVYSVEKLLHVIQSNAFKLLFLHAIVLCLSDFVRGKKHSMLLTMPISMQKLQNIWENNSQ